MIKKDGTLQSYEYEEYAYGNISNITIEFIKEFTEYIIKNNLTEVFSLTKHDNREMVEYVLSDDTSTILLPRKNDNKGVITNWTFDIKDGIIELSGGTIYQATKKKGNPHRVFVDAKKDIKTILKENDLI